MSRTEKNTKICAPFFAFYECAEMERYLEKQAKDGWMFDKFSAFGWVFRRIEPKKIHFAVTYFPKASTYDPAPSEQQLEFRDFCEHTGWKLAAAKAQMQIFYNEAENPVPIETDPSTELSAIHEFAQKHYLPQRHIITFFLLIQFLRPLLSHLDQWTSAQYLVYGIFFLLLYLLSLADIIGYGLWRRRAMKAAETGERFTGFTAHKYITPIIITALLLWLLFTIITAGNLTLRIVLLTILGIIAIAAISTGISTWMKRQMVDSELNLLITMLLSIFFVVVLIAAVSGIVIYRV